MNQLTPQNGYIYRITHIDNIAWILRNGIHSRSSPIRDPGFREIGDRDLIEKRLNRVVPAGPGGTLGDYVPFYFTPRSPMLLNIKTGHRGMRKLPMSEIAILVSSLHRIAAHNLPFVFTDRHAYQTTARYFADIGRLDEIDWQALRSGDFRRDPNSPGKIERYMAEALIHRHVPIDALLGLACFDSHMESRLRGIQQELGVSLKMAIRANWYF